MTQHARIILFDFDYTLGDSYLGILDAVHHSFDAMDRNRPDPDQVHRSIGLPLVDMYCMFTDQNLAEVESEAAAFSQLFMARADEIMADKTKLFEYTTPLINRLLEKQHRLGIVTTKFRRRIETIFHKADIHQHFDTIVGGEDVTKQKPHPEALLLAADNMSCRPQECLYVGDSLTDARAAQAAKMPFVAVLSGATSQADFAPFSPVTILPHAGHLTDHLEEKET